MAFSQAVEMTMWQEVRIAAMMMSQAKFGTIWTMKILDINQHEKVGKSANPDVHQSRMMMILDHPVQYPESISGCSPSGSISV
jgi:hypothetical protein